MPIFKFELLVQASKDSKRMLLSKSCVYGLRASLFLATMDEKDYMPIREISEKLDISFHFLTKILQQLTNAGLMESFRGPNGGVKLTRSATDINLLDIVEAIDGPELLTECALGLPGCGVDVPCPIHEKWAHTRDSIRVMLEHTSLTDMAEKAKREGLRLTAEGTITEFLNV